MQQWNVEDRAAEDSHYIRPKKAELLMKSARTARRTLYVCGPTGYGKTSFVRDMLSRRRYTYLTPNDTDELFSKLDAIIEKNDTKQEMILVLDDLHQVETSESRSELLPRLKALMERKNIGLILISRASVPSWLKALYIQKAFVIINEEALTLNRADIARYYDTWQIPYLEEDIQKSEEIFKGYPLALQIYALHLLAEKKNAGRILEKPDETIQKCSKDLYDYFDVHVIDNWDIELQKFLMDLSIVEHFDVNIAMMLTKRSDVPAMLRRAEEIGSFFTYRSEEPVRYEYHELMRSTMERRLRIKKSREYIEELYGRAGLYYEMKGDVKNALKMYEQGSQKNSIFNLLIKNVRQHVGAGHYWELRKYYLSLPEETIKQSPELMAGMSMLQSVLMNDEQSERWYRELLIYAENSSGSEKARAQARLLYLDIGLPQRGTQNVIELLKMASAVLKNRNSLLPEMSLTNNQPSMMDGGKDFSEWSKRDTFLAKSIGKMAELVSGDYGKGLINLALAESYLEKGHDYFEIAMLADQGRLQAYSGGKMEQVFVGVGILSQLAILSHAYADAMEMLENMEKLAQPDAQQIIPNIRALKARYAMYNGQTADIQEWMREPPDEEEGFCTLERYRYMTKVRAYLALGQKEKALSLLNRMLVYAESRQRTMLWIEIKLLYAVTMKRLNEDCLPVLQEAVTRAEEYHFVRIFVREGAAVYPLLGDPRLEWSDPSYKEQVMRECEGQAKYYSNYLREKTGEIRLSERALMILRLQAAGMKNEAIAAELGMSVGNVKYHNTETYKKLGVKSKAAAITEARNRKWI